MAIGTRSHPAHAGYVEARARQSIPSTTSRPYPAQAGYVKLVGPAQVGHHLGVSSRKAGYVEAPTGGVFCWRPTPENKQVVQQLATPGTSHRTKGRGVIRTVLGVHRAVGADRGICHICQNAALSNSTRTLGRRIRTSWPISRHWSIFVLMDGRWLGTVGHEPLGQWFWVALADEASPVAGARGGRRGWPSALAGAPRRGQCRRRVSLDNG